MAVVRTVKKKHYFECEVGPRGRGVLRQTLLTFCSTTPSVALVNLIKDNYCSKSIIEY